MARLVHPNTPFSPLLLRLQVKPRPRICNRFPRDAGLFWILAIASSFNHADVGHAPGAVHIQTE